MNATRAPKRGSCSTSASAVSTASRHAFGWSAISCSMSLTGALYGTLEASAAPDPVGHELSVRLDQLVAHLHDLGGRERRRRVRVEQRRLVDEVPRLLESRPHRELHDVQ